MSTDENKSKYSGDGAVRNQMKVIEVITPSGSIATSIWAGKLYTDTNTSKKELLSYPSFIVVYGTNEKCHTAIVNVAEKLTAGGVKVIWGASELQAAARTFKADRAVETRPWIVCLDSMERIMVQTLFEETKERKSLHREWKEFYASPTELLIEEMLDAITSVVFFGCEWLKVDYLAHAMFSTYGNKFESLDLFKSTIKRILEYPNTDCMELIPGRFEKSCIVRRLK